MMEFVGNLKKMRAELTKPINYFLDFEEEQLLVNEYLGKLIRFEYTGEINCIKCGRKTKKSFSQGFCYPCFSTAPETEECVLRPELCKAHEGVARNMDFAKTHCLIDHFVYLSLTSGIKVGVTRNTQIPTRWIDQGAVKAIILAQTPNRNLAGQIEVVLKNYMADKTNWRNMLTNKITDDRDLQEVKALTASRLPSELQKYISGQDSITELDYPNILVPEKVTSLNFDKTPIVEGVLTGIKGQYLIFDNRAVLNIRKFGGYKINLTIGK